MMCASAMNQRSRLSTHAIVFGCLAVWGGVSVGGIPAVAQDKAQEKKADGQAHPKAEENASAKAESKAESESHGKAAGTAHEGAFEKSPADKSSASKSSTGASAAAAAGEHGSGAGHAAEGAHGGGHGDHHDPTDLSHQNAGPMLEDPSQWKSDLAIGTLLVFLGLLVLLTKFAWRPVMEGLERRESAIAANIEQAQRSAEQAAAQLRQYEAKLAAATDEAREIVGQARRDADAARERILADAQAAAQRERQRAIEDIQGAKNLALQEMTQKSVDLAVALAGRMVRRQLQPEDHAQLIREVLEQFPSRN